MRLIKIFLCLFIFINLIKAEENVNINFQDLEIMDLVKITSKVINKNILLTYNIKGKVDFVSNKPIKKKDLINILIYTLESKGYTLISNDQILRIVRITDASKYNLKVVNRSTNDYGMITEVFQVDNSNVDYISSKIRHLISTSAKLVTDKESNSIILTDFGENIKTVKKIIQLVSKDNEKITKVVKLKNLQAVTVQPELVNMAKALYNPQIQKEQVSILVNKDTNSIMFIGKNDNISSLSHYLEKIDNEGSLVAKSIEVIYLKNIESKNILTMLTGLIANKQYKDPNDKPYAAIDEESNSVVLMGAKDEIGYFKEIITKLDVDRQQVYVQARIIELSETRTKNIGIEYGLTGFASSSNGLLSFSSALTGEVPNVTNLVSGATSLGFSVPTLRNALGLSATINLLKQYEALDVVSEPSLLCINNKESSIYVGETTSIPTQLNNGTTTSTSFQREDIGLRLKVKPRISNGDKVTLEIEAVLEDIASLNTNGAPPDTNKKELQTLAIVNNGESVVLGGLIKNRTSSTEEKVPFLGDIPLLGALFRNNRDLTDKINLIIVVTPYIIPQTKDLTYIREKLAELKLLEDKYTKDTFFRLQKKKLDIKKEDLIREKKRIDFAHDEKDFQTESREFLEDVKLDDRLEDSHKQRVEEIFGF